MTSVSPVSRQQVALQLLLRGDSGEKPKPIGLLTDGPSLRRGDSAQQSALERIIKLSLERAGSSDGFLVVMPVNAEFIESGSGNDTVNVTSSGDDTAPNYISLGDGNDKLNLVSTEDATSDYWQGRTGVSGAVVTNKMVGGKEIAIVIPSGRGIFAGAGNDVVNIAAGRDAYNVYAGEGNDVLTVAAGRDISGIFGGDGRDVLTLAGRMNLDNVTGGDGDDIITVAMGNEARSISGGEGRDIITVAGKKVGDISGGQGADVITIAAGEAVYSIRGGDGDDTIAIAAAKVNGVEGGGGDDTIRVNARTADAISGGLGDDRIDLTGTGKAKLFFDRGDGKDIVRVAGETTIVFAERSIDDADISYGDGKITISLPTRATQ
jgi:Ca2+-binding RTX toxin-like protein